MCHYLRGWPYSTKEPESNGSHKSPGTRNTHKSRNPLNFGKPIVYNEWACLFLHSGVYTEIVPSLQKSELQLDESANELSRKQRFIKPRVISHSGERQPRSGNLSWYECSGHQLLEAFVALLCFLSKHYMIDAIKISNRPSVMLPLTRFADSWIQ